MDQKKEQFSLIYRENIEKIYRFAYLKVNSQEIAEDLTSKVFLKGWEAFKSGEDIKNPSAFLYQIARNMVIDHYRAKGKSTTVSMDNVAEMSDGTDSHAMAVFSADLEAVKKGISQLKKEYQDVIIWHYLEDMGVKDIAKLVEKPEGTVRVMLHRGLKDLRDIIKEG